MVKKTRYSTCMIVARNTLFHWKFYTLYTGYVSCGQSPIGRIGFSQHGIGSLIMPSVCIIPYFPNDIFNIDSAP